MASQEAPLINPSSNVQNAPSAAPPIPFMKPPETEYIELVRSFIHCRNPLITNVLSEFFGTFLMMFIGIAISQHFCFARNVGASFFQSVGWGFAYCLAMFACIKTSGGHLNPCVSFLLMTFGKLGIVEFALYVPAQMVGSFLGSALSYLLYLDFHWVFDAAHAAERIGVAELKKQMRAAAKVAGMPDLPVPVYIGASSCFISMPITLVTNANFFVHTFVTCALLGLSVAVITDRRNRVPEMARPLLFALSFILICIAFSSHTTDVPPMNPARDFAPRIFATMLYGFDTFVFHNYYFWIPVIASFPGITFGGWLYQLAIGAHIPDEDEARSSPNC